MFRSFPHMRESRSFFPWPWIPAFAGMSGEEMTRIPLIPAHAGIQIFLSLALDPRFRGDERDLSRTVPSMAQMTCRGPRLTAAAGHDREALFLQAKRYDRFCGA